MLDNVILPLMYSATGGKSTASSIALSAKQYLISLVMGADSSHTFLLFKEETHSN